jgi:RIO-like serine/threonine protein kinase
MITKVGKINLSNKQLQILSTLKEANDKHGFIFHCMVGAEYLLQQMSDKKMSIEALLSRLEILKTMGLVESEEDSGVVGWAITPNGRDVLLLK